MLPSLAPEQIWLGPPGRLPTVLSLDLEALLVFNLVYKPPVIGYHSTKTK